MSDTPKQKIKVLHAIRQGKIGGGETHVLDLVANLNPDVFDSEVLSFTKGEMVERLRAMGIVCHVIHTTSPFDIRVWNRVKRLIVERGIQVVHAHGTRACSNVFFAANSLHVPLLYTIHGWSFHQDQAPLTRKMREAGERLLTQRTEVNISVSRSNNQDGVERFGMPNSVVVNYGVNLEKFDPYKDYSLSRTDLGLPADKIIAGMVARLTVQKDPLSFVRAAAEAMKKTDNLHFLIVGDGDLANACSKLVKECGIENNISFAGFRTDVPEVLNLIDIYCLPSLWEGLPIGLLEAMAMKKAIVATPVDGTKEVIRHRETGMLFKEEDFKAMAGVIVELAEAPGLRSKIAKSAREVIERDFGVERMAEEIGELYQRVLRNNETEVSVI